MREITTYVIEQYCENFYDYLDPASLSNFASVKKGVYLWVINKENNHKNARLLRILYSIRDLELLEYVNAYVKSNCQVWKENTTRMIAKYGHIDLMEYAIDNGINFIDTAKS